MRKTVFWTQENYILKTKKTVICETNKTEFCETRKTVICEMILFRFISFGIVLQNRLKPVRGAFHIPHCTLSVIMTFEWEGFGSMTLRRDSAGTIFSFHEKCL